jgi:putative SOS response-associated peptidase YedK
MTTAPNEFIEGPHDRMLAIEPDSFELWLETGAVAETLRGKVGNVSGLEAGG